MCSIMSVRAQSRTVVVFRPSLRVILYSNAKALLYKIVSRSLQNAKVLDTSQ